MNLARGVDDIIPKISSIIVDVCGTADLFRPKTHENVAILEASPPERRCSLRCCLVTWPEDPALARAEILPTYKIIAPLVFVKVCDFVEFAFYHIKGFLRVGARSLPPLSL